MAKETEKKKMKKVSKLQDLPAKKLTPKENELIKGGGGGRWGG